MAYDEALADRVRTTLSRRKGVAEKKMFGGLCFMWRGHMTVGVVDDKLMLRVGKDDYEKLLAEKHAAPMDFTGKPMAGMLYVLPKGIREDDDLKRWVKRACDFVKTMPAK